jgi:rare lipoprotein A
VSLRRLAAPGAIALALACAHGRPPAEPGGPGEAPAPSASRAGGGDRGARGQVGLASWYGRRFQGRRTASGERYDMRRMTCAHRTAPFGTRLRVTDLETGRSVVVVVNDRGPYARGRIVDLSWAAARELDLRGRGLARVRVEEVGAAAAREAAAARAQGDDAGARGDAP